MSADSTRIIAAVQHVVHKYFIWIIVLSYFIAATFPGLGLMIRSDSDHLRAFLKRLPDFDDLEAEERATSYALKFPDVHHALAFVVSWPALDKAAALVTERSAELDGDHYEILSPAADALALLARFCGSHQLIQSGRIGRAWAHCVHANAAIPQVRCPSAKRLCFH